MTLCAQYTDNMKKINDNKAFYDALEKTTKLFALDLYSGEIIEVNCANEKEHAQSDVNDYISDFMLNKPKPKRPRGKKVYSTDKMVKR